MGSLARCGKTLHVFKQGLKPGTATASTSSNGQQTTVSGIGRNQIAWLMPSLN
jgi:hypothetical protein